MARPIVFLSDFGLNDGYVGVCHGVLARIAPAARVIDLTHGIPPHDIRRAALELAAAVPYLPAESVYLAVVDPGVGTRRRALAVRTGGSALTVGPDNGLFSLVWERLGGVESAVEITSPRVTLPRLSATFHGRDVFAPAAAHLAVGMPLEQLGPAVHPGTVARLQLPGATVGDGSLRGEVIGIDRFGNLQLSVRPDDLDAVGLPAGARAGVEVADRDLPATRVRTFGDVAPGAWALFVDSAGWAALAVNGASAADAVDARLGTHVTLRPVG